MSLDRKLLDNFLPEGFETQNSDGYKENFDADRIRTGFDKDTLEILSGPNLNNFLDKTGKNFNVLQEVMQFLKDMPIGCFPFINASNQLDYKNISSFFRNVGEIVYSSVPLDDDNLHLADGSIIEGNGKYRRFIKYMVDLMNDYPSLFVTNEVYNTTVNKYGVCGKYVYDSQANTLRLPTYTGIMEATLDSSSLGNVVEAGIPNITGDAQFTQEWETWGVYPYSGAFYLKNRGGNGVDGSRGAFDIVGFDANRSNPVYGRLQPGAKNQVQPQTVKVYPYVVLSIDESQKQQLTAVYVYQGSVPTKEDLPKEGNVLGHVYNVEYDGFMYGQNYAWNGEDWDPLGGIVDLSKYFTKIEVSNQFATKLSLESNVEFLQGQISQNRADINTLDAGGVISKTPSKLKAATLLATVMDKPQSDIEIFNILMDKKRSSFDKSKFNVAGTPTITDDGVASGFSADNYIKTSTITKSANQTFEIDIEFDTSTLSTQNIITYDNNFFVYMTNSTMYFVGGGWTAGQFLTLTPQANSNYKIKWGWDGAQYYIKYSVNGVQQTDITASWTIGHAFGSFFKIGYGPAANPFLGQIDLSHFSITVDGKEVFSGNKTGLDTIKPDNYEVVGSPVISEDGVASGFSHSNYVKANVSFNQNNKVRFRISGIYTESTSAQSLFSFYSTRLELASSSCSFKWNNVWIIGTSFSEQIKTGDIVDVDLILDNIGGHKIKVYKNGILIGDAVSNTQTTELNIVNLRVGDYQQLDGFYWQGSIDLNAFKIYVDGNLVYQPCLKIPYTQSKTGSKIVDVACRDRVQDMYEQFGYTHYYTLGDEPTIPNAYTLPTVSKETIVDMYESENGTWEQRADLTLRQRGISCTSGTPVTLLKEFRDDKYSLSIGYSSKSASSFTPSASGDWFAEGKVYLQ